MIVYLCGPIDQVTGAEATAWRTAMAEELRKVGIAVFDPAAAFRCDLEGSVPAGNEEYIVAVDLLAVSVADALVVLETGRPTCGTYVEAGVAWEADVPIVVWGERSEVPPFLLGIADRVSAYLNDVVTDVQDVLSEEEEI